MKRRVKRTGITLLVMVGLLSLVAVFHEPILRTTARVWVVDSVPRAPVDAIIIPGGGLETRPFGAANLFHAGISDTLLTFATEVNPTEAMGLTRPSHEVTLEVLQNLKVPVASVEVIHAAVTSTQDEVQAVRIWAEENDIRSLLIVTDVFPSRRVRRAYHRGLEELEIEISVHAIPARNYEVDTWWRSEQGLIAFQNEVIKFFYYLIRY